MEFTKELSISKLRYPVGNVSGILSSYTFSLQNSLVAEMLRLTSVAYHFFGA